VSSKRNRREGILWSYIREIKIQPKEGDNDSNDTTIMTVTVSMKMFCIAAGVVDL